VRERGSGEELWDWEMNVECAQTAKRYLSSEEIVGVVGGSNLHSSSAKRHVNQHSVTYDGDAAADEGMHKELPVQVSVAGVFGMNCHGGITKHGLKTSGGYHNFIVTAFDFVREFDEDPELVRTVAVARNALAFRLFELLCVNFNVRNGALEGACAKGITTSSRAAVAVLE
jgi:hypothetical protein